MIAPAVDVPAKDTGPPQTEAQRIEELLLTVSPSRLSAWLQCRLRFYFRYVKKIHRSKPAVLHVGSVLHAVLQAWNKARWRKQAFDAEISRNLFDVTWPLEKDKVNWKGEEDRKRNQAWSLLELYFRETPIQPDERPEAVEVPMETDLSRHGFPMLIGIIDLVRAGGKIVDFKTSGQTPKADKATHLHEIQTSCYAVLYRDATGKRESGIELHHLVKTKKPKLIITMLPPMYPEQQIRLFRILESYVEGLARKDFVPSPGLQCAACEYFNECRRWC